MKLLPKSLPKFLFILVLLVVLPFVLTQGALAASAYVSPATGLITNQDFKVSFYVESSTTEPKIAGAKLVVTYPTNVKVVSINDGEFDSYLEKTDDPTKNQITINALNNEGAYKTGKVKVASVNFKAQEASGDVQLTIDSSSGISGEGGEQLLTETVNGVYTLEVADFATEENTTTEKETETVQELQETTTEEVPETGGNSILLFAVISSLLIGVGALSLLKPASKN